MTDKPQERSSDSSRRSRSGSSDRKRSGGSRSSNKRRSSSSSHQPYAEEPSIITWPYRKIRYLWRYWGPGTAAKKSLERLGGVSSSILKFEGERKTFRRDDGQLLIRNWPSKATMMNPLWWVVWAGQFGFRWIASRPVWPMTLALPALLVVGIVLAASSRGARVSSATEIARHKRAFNDLSSTVANSDVLKIKEEDLPLAKMTVDALIRLDNKNPDHFYTRAKVEEAAGNMQVAHAMMNDLAVSQGDYRAAIWKSRQVGNTEIIETWTKPQLIEFLDWLNLAIKNDPDKKEPRVTKGHLLRFLGDTRGAYQAYRPIAAQDPEIDYLVAYLEKQLGMEEQSQARAKRLGRVFRDKVESEPQNIDYRSKAAAMLVLQGRESQAIEVLQGGIPYANEEQLRALKSAIVDVKVLQANEQFSKESGIQGAVNRLTSLVQALQIDASNQNLMNAIIEATVQAAEADNDQLNKLQLELIEKVPPDTAHFILGTIELNRGNIQAASRQLEIAVADNKNMPGMLNNLAYALLQEDEPDLERALSYSQMALESMPRHPALRETRGQILLRLKRYTEAISDLEFALIEKSLRPAIRKGLAEAYEAIGQPDIAQQQLKLLEAGR